MELSTVLINKRFRSIRNNLFAARGVNVGLILTAVTLLALFIAVFAAIQYATPGLAGNDG